MMPLLFSYGTLQLESVQLQTFGRQLAGWRDELHGYQRSKVAIDDPKVAVTLGKTHHDNVEFTGNEECRVSGMVFEITEEEVASVDAYEAQFSYVRVAAMLASGTEAWVYVHSGSHRH